MQQGFIYIWRDSERGMYYIGSHDGNEDDGYISSSRWFNGEQRFRPQCFRRRILKRVLVRDLRAEEHALLSKIKDTEFGIRYYNLKSGRPKGSAPWNTGKEMSAEYCNSIKEGLKAKGPRLSWCPVKPKPDKIIAPLTGANNGKRSAAKQSKTVMGRKMAIVNGKRTWIYPGKEAGAEAPA